MFILFLLSFVLTSVSVVSLHFDSLVNNYKQIEYYQNTQKDLNNSTWKEIVVADTLLNLVKCIPALIDLDKELDLLVLDSETRLYWVSNVRGTSGTFSHQFVSKSKLLDFVIQGDALDRKNFYLLGINSSGRKILKFNSIENPLNNSVSWEESEIFNLDDNVLGVTLRDYKITGINLYPLSESKQYLFLTINNYNGKVSIIKIIIQNQIIESLSLLPMTGNIIILGAFDMNNDGLVDLVYVDDYSNILILINNDPYYLPVFVSSVNSISKHRKAPRIFISDNNHDNYPDIIIGDSKDNSIGLLFNPGMKFWEDSLKFFSQKNFNDDSMFRGQTWYYVPLYDVKEYKLNNEKLLDFTIIPSKHTTSRRINFEIFALYETNFYWFIEKSLNISSSLIWGANVQPKNYIYCMVKNDVVVDRVTDFTRIDKSYDLIIDLDINFDAHPEFILYYENSLFLIKRYTPYISGFGWNSNFWIYVCIYMYVVCSILGLYEFFKLSTLNQKIRKEKLLKTEEDENNSDRIKELKVLNNE